MMNNNTNRSSVVNLVHYLFVILAYPSTTENSVTQNGIQWRVAFKGSLAVGKERCSHTGIVLFLLILFLLVYRCLCCPFLKYPKGYESGWTFIDHAFFWQSDENKKKISVDKVEYHL